MRKRRSREEIGMESDGWMGWGKVFFFIWYYGDRFFNVVGYMYVCMYVCS